MSNRGTVWLPFFSIILLLYIPQILPLKLKRGKTSFQLRDLGYTSVKHTLYGTQPSPFMLCHTWHPIWPQPPHRKPHDHEPISSGMPVTSHNTPMTFADQLWPSTEVFSHYSLHPHKPWHTVQITSLPHYPQPIPAAPRHSQAPTLFLIWNIISSQILHFTDLIFFT